jgi:ribosomal protein L4
VDTEDNVLMVKGAVPGPNGGYVWCGGPRGNAMPTVDVVDLNNQKVGELELADEVFGAEVNEDLLYEAVRHYLAGQRAATQDQVRGEVAGSGKKAVEAEGHRPRPHRFGAVADLAAWRHGARSAAARLQL